MGGNRNPYGFYQGADVDSVFMERWRRMDHTGSSRPFCEVLIRRGHLNRSWHTDWPDPQFGQTFGKSIRQQWYADWQATDDWMALPAVGSVDLDQSFDNNGTAVATVECDNVAWTEAFGPAGSYHTRERGYLWPWRGYRHPRRPGSAHDKNQWWARLPNAQILVRQGYGEDTAVKTFTGLVDTLDVGLRPDKMTLSARDFGGVLADSYVFGWNKTRSINDPITFAPKHYERFAWARRQASTAHHRWIIIEDATDIVKVVLRWMGFKHFEIEKAGVDLTVPYTVDKSHTMMDVINDIATALGYVFFIAEPLPEDDLDIGVPIFRRPSVLVRERSLPISMSSGTPTHQGKLTDLKPKHDNKDDRYIIRVRGVMNRKIGRTLYGDSAKRVTFEYWPPWMPRMAGVIKQLTYYDIGSNGVLGLTSIQQCIVATLLIAIQIALGRDTAVAQTAGNPALGLDSFAFVADEATGVTGRVYITNRKSTMKIGGDGTSQLKSPYGGGGGGGQNELLWATEFGGALCDNPDFDTVVKHYKIATSGRSIASWKTQE